MSAAQPEPSKVVPLAPAGSARKLLGNAGIYAVGTLALQGLSAAFTPLLALLLVPAELGLWSLSTSLFNGLSLFYTLGLQGAITRYYYDHEHQPFEQRRFQATISTFLFGWASLASLLLLVIGPWLLGKSASELHFQPYGVLIIAMCFLSVASLVPKALWQAQERPKAFVGVELVASTINIAGSLLLVSLTSIGVLGLFWGRLLSLAVVAVTCLHYSARSFGLALHGPSLRSALLFSLPLVPHLLAHWVLAMADRVLIERALGLAQVGVYAIAYSFIEMVNLVATSVNRAWVPQFTRAYADPEQRPFVARSITVFVLASLGTAAALLVLSPTLVRLLYNQKYEAAAPIAPILAGAGVFQALYYIYVAGLFYYKKNRLVPVITVSGGALNIALNLWLLPRFGIAGAAWATLAGYLALALGMRWACRLHTRLPFETGRLAKLVAVALGFCVLGLLVDARLPLALELVVKLALLGAAFYALVRTGFFAPEELARLRAVLRLPARGA
jgi:O-antigen/teichoic acid export membrane protein